MGVAAAFPVRAARSGDAAAGQLTVEGRTFRHSRRLVMAVIEIYNQGQLITKREVTTTVFVSGHSIVPVAKEILF